MAAVLRRLGFKKHEPRESEARQKLQKELFSYNQCVEHGFPHKPTALAHDPKLKLMAIGTKHGSIRVLGRPGVEYSGQHAEDVEVSKLFFLPEQARLLSLCSDNSLHLWEINTRDGNAVIEDVRSVHMDPSKVKSITSCCLTNNAEQLFLGTESGNIHVLNLPDLKLSEQIIYQDVVMQNVPDDLKANPGPVETIAQHPSKPEKFLIGYNRGVIVLWDNSENQAEQTYSSSQQLESLAWHRDGTQFMSAHSDGSHIVWNASDSTKPMEQSTTTYGPFPCKGITKIQWKTAKSDPFIIFAGGMPRASYGDRHTVTAMQGGTNHAVFDFASKVIDFVSICSADELEDYDKFEYDDPHSLLVLTEEEIVAIDLQTDGWPQFALPYLNSLHSSSITCTAHVSNVPDAFWTKIVDAGEPQFSSLSTRDWPITGGQTLPQSLGAKNLLLTGHEDGSVRFWDVSTTSQKLMYTLKTANIFGTDAGVVETADEDEGWPPFKKVGTFDPYSDDPRLTIQKMTLCPLSETLVVSGTAGQTVVMQWEREERTQDVKVTNVSIVTEKDGFVWKGHEALPVKGGEVKFAAGFQPVCVMQVDPPAAATAQALHSEWQMLAVGTAHGFAIFDYNQRVACTSMCTLDPAHLHGAAASGPMSRAKTFKKSLRESFRRLRKRRGGDGQKKSPKTSPKKSKPESPKKEEKEEQGPSSIEAPAGEEPKTEEGATAATTEEGATAEASATPAPEAPSPTPAPVETVDTGDTSSKPVEREISARSEKAKSNEEMNSMIRTIHFADTYVMQSNKHGPSVWLGTNAGFIYIYEAFLPESDKRDSEPVKAILAKEVKLQHGAPVINMTVIDRTATPLPGALEVQHERAKAANMTGGHHLVVCSEEQIKIFQLPHLKASTKYKLTAHEGAKLRKVGYVNFRSKSDERYQENDLAVLTNQGDVQVWTVPNLRRQLKAECVKKENVNGIMSGFFTQTGEGFFLASPSEFVRFSLSARFVPKPACEVLLKDGVRPPLPEPEPEPEAVAAEEPAEAAAEPAATEDAAAAASGEAAAAEAAPAEEKKDVAAEGEKTEDEGSKPQEEGAGDSTLDATGADDSLEVADTTGEITLDSVKVYLNESTTEASESKVEVVESSHQLTKTTVTKTVITETSEGGQVTSQETVTTTTTEVAGSGDAPAEVGATGGSGPNLDDDSKLTSHDEIESQDNSEDLEKLYISEESDEASLCIANTQHIVSNTQHTVDGESKEELIEPKTKDLPQVTGDISLFGERGDERADLQKESVENRNNDLLNAKSETGVDERLQCQAEVEEFLAPVLAAETECSGSGRQQQYEEHPGDEIVEFVKEPTPVEIDDDCAPFEIETPVDESDVPREPARSSVALDDLIDNLKEIATKESCAEQVGDIGEIGDITSSKEPAAPTAETESGDQPSVAAFDDDFQLETVAENLVSEVLDSVLQQCSKEPQRFDGGQQHQFSEGVEYEKVLDPVVEEIEVHDTEMDESSQKRPAVEGDSSGDFPSPSPEPVMAGSESSGAGGLRAVGSEEAPGEEIVQSQKDVTVAGEETPEGVVYYVTTVAGIPPAPAQAESETAESPCREGDLAEAGCEGTVMTVAGIEASHQELAGPVEIARYDASDDEYEYVEILEEVEVTDDEGVADIPTDVKARNGDVTTAECDVNSGRELAELGNEAHGSGGDKVKAVPESVTAEGSSEESGGASTGHTVTENDIIKRSAQEEGSQAIPSIEIREY